ncbi:MAG: protein-glutamate O-methyltransferase CheR [Bacteroidetes bacterium]|nr:protein-glutamate O-methyltransferase CheR [Bacteroidota bacterium]
METKTTSDAVDISDEELKSLTDAIHQRHGIDFSCYEPKSLKRRVIRALHIFQLRAVHELWIKILKDHSFIYPFMDEISVGLTSMFRDPILWKKLSKLLATELAVKERLAIWHAGCSTGEEVYTMGIVLNEVFYARPVEAVASDISNQAMAIAQMGEYNELKIEEYAKNYQQFNASNSLSKYYKVKDGNVQFEARLIRHVRFEHHNLITGPFVRKFDIIFCRNVMIYFDNEAKKKLFNKFYDSLNPGGLFIIGFYDAVLPLIDPNKFKVLDMDAKIFVKI